MKLHRLLVLAALLLTTPVAIGTLGAQEPSTDETPSRQPHGQHGTSTHGQGMHHDFSDVERYAERFEGPDRIAWQRPEHVVSLLQIRPGMTVVDLGAGTGFFEPYLAAAVGPDGRVLALDVEPAMVSHISQRVEEEGLGPVEARLVPYDDPELEAASVDRVLIVNTWHHIDDRALYAGKLKEALTENGRVYVVDFERDSPHGPPARHRLTAREVVAELEGGGLQATPIEEELPHQYIVVATRLAE